MTPFNYPGHKLMEHAIDKLRISGDEYVKYLKSKSYRTDIINDLIGSIARSELYTKKLDFDLYNDKSYKPVAVKTNLAMKKAIFDLSAKNWFNKYKLKRKIKEFKNYFSAIIPPCEDIKTLANNEYGSLKEELSDKNTFCSGKKVNQSDKDCVENTAEDFIRLKLQTLHKRLKEKGLMKKDASDKEPDTNLGKALMQLTIRKKKKSLDK